jgi:hypothetical protein
MLPPNNVKGLGTYVGKRGKTGITSNLTEHNSTRMQPTLQISHGKLQPKPGKTTFSNIRNSRFLSGRRNISNYFSSWSKLKETGENMSSYTERTLLSLINCFQ